MRSGQNGRSDHGVQLRSAGWFATLSALVGLAACQSTAHQARAGVDMSAGAAVAATSGGAGAGEVGSAGVAAPGIGGSGAPDASAAGGGGPTHAVAGDNAGAFAAGGGGRSNVPAAGSGGQSNGAGAGGQAQACPGGACAGSSAQAGGTSGAAGAGAAGATTPDPKYLVKATGPCPEFKNGDVMFSPDGVSRKVLLYIGDQAKTLDGPLVFSWHSTIPDPSQANVWLGDSVIADIKAKGGLVAAPYTGYPGQTRPWDNVPGGAQNTDGDQRLMDEVVACAIEKVGIDVRHIHAIGMSAGGLKTAQVSLRRSGYLASVVVYSGGLVQSDNPPDQDPHNLFAAMIFYGGATDISPVDGIPYTDASRRYLDLLVAHGRFAFLCNHGGGHNVPQDSQASAWRFMQDHPFGTSPSPYAMGLPTGFPRYCSLNNP